MFQPGRQMGLSKKRVKTIRQMPRQWFRQRDVPSHLGIIDTVDFFHSTLANQFMRLIPLRDFSDRMVERTDVFRVRLSC